jgi:hypothetical protein
MRTTKHYSPEVRERAVRMVLELSEQYDSQWAAIRSVASKIKISTSRWMNRTVVMMCVQLRGPSVALR